MMKRIRATTTTAVLLCGLLVLAGCERPPTETIQRGYRGTGMVQVYNPRTVAETAAANTPPAATPAVDPGGPAAKSVYKNVEVLGDLTVGEFTRTMLAITSWVSPKEGCNYCHAAGDFASDDRYTKVVARRMLKMTQHINADWKAHVADTGVTCYTCHRGQPVPAQVWYTDPGPRTVRGPAGNRAGQNAPAAAVGLASLPYDPFTRYLAADAHPIRVAATEALPGSDGHSIQETEGTYALMMHMSKSLGVNCTYCHESRSFGDWSQSTPQRETAWYGLRMVRDLNVSHLMPLGKVFPPERLGPEGDVPKVSCATCHQGVYKPLYGATMLKDHPELAAVASTAQPPAAGAATEAAPQAGQ